MMCLWARLLFLLALVLTACGRPQLSEAWLFAAAPGANLESEPVPLKTLTEGEEEALARRPRLWRPVRVHTFLRVPCPPPVHATVPRFQPPDASEAPAPVCVRAIPLLC